LRAAVVSGRAPELASARVGCWAVVRMAGCLALGEVRHAAHRLLPTQRVHRTVIMSRHDVEVCVSSGFSVLHRASGMAAVLSALFCAGLVRRTWWLSFTCWACFSAD
jgi:hypothetical protein